MVGRAVSRALGRRWQSSNAKIDRCTPQIAPIPGRSVLHLSGKDAQKYLKGLTSRDVDKTPGWGYSGFLTPTGRVLHDAFIYPLSSPGDLNQAYLIDYPTPSVEDSQDTEVKPLIKHLKKYVLRSKIKIRDVSEEYDSWSVVNTQELSDWSPSSSWKLGSGGAGEITWNTNGEEAIKQLRMSEQEVGSWDLRAGFGPGSMGRRLLVRRGDLPSFQSDHNQADTSSFLLHRMINGVPEGPQELVPNVALPLEGCMDVMGGVDFRKGCYVGQELTVRTYHTGNTRKRIMPIRFYSPSQQPGEIAKWSSLTGLPKPIAGEAINYIPAISAPSQKPRPGVKVLSVHPEYAVGLGLVRLELLSRVHELTPFGQIGTPLGSEADVGYLVSGDLKSNIDGSQLCRVWAGRGRGWYTPEEQAAV